MPLIQRAVRLTINPSPIPLVIPPAPALAEGHKEEGPVEKPRDGCWDVLGLPPTATRAELDRRYRELIKIQHPDRSGEKEECMKLQEAHVRSKRILEVPV